MKQEQILEAAIKRFSHFGIQKTNLAEIAEDLGISKPALFYYFSDKQTLIAAVQERIISEYIEAMEKGFAGAATVDDALVRLIEVRSEFLEKYFMLASRLEDMDPVASGKAIDEVKQTLRDRELALLTGLFEKGVQSGELKPLEGEKTAGLLLDTVSALAYCVRGKSIPPNHQEVVELFKKQKDVLRLLYNGLKK